MSGAFLSNLDSKISKALSWSSGKAALPSFNSRLCRSASASTIAGIITLRCSAFVNCKANWSRLGVVLEVMIAQSAWSNAIADSKWPVATARCIRRRPKSSVALMSAFSFSRCCNAHGHSIAKWSAVSPLIGDLWLISTSLRILSSSFSDLWRIVKTRYLWPHSTKNQQSSKVCQRVLRSTCSGILRKIEVSILK